MYVYKDMDMVGKTVANQTTAYTNIFSNFIMCGFKKTFETDLTNQPPQKKTQSDSHSQNTTFFLADLVIVLYS